MCFTASIKVREESESSQTPLNQQDDTTNSSEVPIYIGVGVSVGAISSCINCDGPKEARDQVCISVCLTVLLVSFGTSNHICIECCFLLDLHMLELFPFKQDLLYWRINHVSIATSIVSKY